MCVSILAACFPAGPEASEESFEEGSEEVLFSRLAPDEEGVIETKSVFASLQTARTAGGTLGLVSDIRDVSYRLSSCKSGYGPSLNTFSARTLGLYRFDRDCEIHVDRVNISGTDFKLPSGVSFNGQLNALNTFVSSDGQSTYIKVLSQLPQVLETSAYAVSFLISESLSGAQLSHTIYEVGISADLSAINETSPSPATLTVRRAAPASSPLEVKLSYEGDATPGIDTNVLPSSITLAAGQTTKSFTISAINDSVFEGDEYIRVRVAPGLNYIPKSQFADVNILDDDIALLTFDAATYNFAGRASKLPHSMKAKVTNVGNASASQIQLASPLASPFLFPGGFPGDNATCGTILPPGQSCFLTLGFNPTSTSILTATMTLSYFNSAVNAQVQASLRGNGAGAAHLSLSEPGFYEFPPQAAGQSLRRHITVSNLGSVTASALNGTFSSSNFSYAGGSFPGVGGSCGTSLSADAQCTIVLSFAASEVGFYEGSFQLNYSNGSQTLSQSLSLEGSISALRASSESYPSGLNRALALKLSSDGGSGTVTYEVLSQPSFGTLSGIAPNLSYMPSANFTGVDSFTFRAIDASGPSAPAQIRIFVRPRALMIVGSFNLESIEQSIISQLGSLGFSVTTQDDNLSSVTDASAKELLVFSRTARRNRYQNKFYDSPVPAMVWDTTDMKEMRMLSGNANTVTSRQIRITNPAHPIAKGLAAGLQTVFSRNEALAYGISNSANVQTIATTSSNTSQAAIFGYEEGNYLPGGQISPARRLATSLPDSNSSLTSIGWTLFDQSVSWLIQGGNSLVQDTFQRDPSLSLGKAWLESENGNPEAFQIAGDQLQFNSHATISSAKLALPLQDSGIITFSFYLDLKKGSAAVSDYLQEFQLGRCDLMDKDFPNNSGAAVHLLWGGIASGLQGEEFLGSKIGNAVTSLGQVNTRKAPISVEVDITNKRYTVRMPSGTLSPSINFDSQVAIDCVRLTSRNINSTGFIYRGINNLKVVLGR